MIDPPDGLSGAASLPITIRALNDGKALLDGQFERDTVTLVTGNNWWILEGFNGKNGAKRIVHIIGGSNNIIRRIVGWDIDFTDAKGNAGTIFSCQDDPSGQGGINNLFEDVAGFGISNHIFGSSQNGFGGCTYRRVWGRAEGSADSDNAVGPSYAMYNSRHTTFENSIVEIRWAMPQSYTVVNQLSNSSGWCGADYTCTDGAPLWSSGSGWHINRLDGDPPDFDARILGSIGYVTAGANLSRKLLTSQGGTCPSDSLCSMQMASHARRGGNIMFKDVLWIVDPSHAHFTRTRALQMFRMDTTLPLVLDHVSTVAGNPNKLNEGTAVGTWTMTSGIHASSLAGLNGQNANPWTGTQGANLCYQYEKRQKTTKPLWPWPMNERIKEATASAGVYAAGYPASATGCDLAKCVGSFPSRPVADVTATIESLLGSIPAACRTAGAPAPSPAPVPLSTAFRIGDRIQVSATRTNVRSSGSPSATILGTQQMGAQGTVIGGPVTVDGGTVWWWQIDYDSGFDGWSFEGNLSPVASLSGDLNADGQVNALDLQLEVNVILGTETNATIKAKTDLNGDGQANALDLQRLVNIVLGV